MTSPIDAQYQQIAGDPEYRQKLIADPKGFLGAEYGYQFPAEVKLRIMEQSENKIMLFIPAKPTDQAAIDAPDVGTRVVDLLFVDGMGGYLVPTDELKWVVRDMRSAWGKKFNSSS